MNNMSGTLKAMYHRRFGDEITFRKEMWRVLCNDFFQKYVNPNGHIMEVAAGYCEFINNIKAQKKTALDLNPDVEQFASEDVQVVVSDSTNMTAIADGSVDTVFVSNFFEHIPHQQIEKTIIEIKRILSKNGKLIIIQPNIRFCLKDFWMFFDHITPLDDRAFVELLELKGFNIIESRDRFLPYTTKSRLPKSLLLIKLYLKFPLIWKLLGGQMFIFAEVKGDK